MPTLKAAIAKNGVPKKVPGVSPRPKKSRVADAPKPPTRKRVIAATLPGGYRVYGTPLDPVHTTREQIAKAIAALK